MRHHSPITPQPSPLVYLFERFPAFTQTFCAREVLAMERAGWAPVVFSIRNPRELGEPAPDFLPAEVLARVRYLPGEKEIIDEVRWLRRQGQLSEGFAAAEPGWRTRPDKGRFYEAALLAWRLRESGLRHVHVHFAGLAARTAFWMQRYGGFTYSLTGHANDLFRPGDPDDAPAPGDVLAGACFVVTESEFAAARMRARHPELARYFCPVHNGLDLKTFSVARPAENPPRVLAVGRLIEKKGFADLVAALARLRARGGVPFAAEIVGEGPLRGELLGAVNAAGLRDVVTLPGALSQRVLRERLAGARVFVLPCVEEADGAGGMDNFPTVIAEAMAAGLPVVSTATAGVPEMVLDGQTGRLVPPRSPDALAEVLGPLLTDGALAARLGQAGRQRAEERFSADASARQLGGLLAGRTPLRPRPAVWRRDPALAWREFWREQRG